MAHVSSKPATGKKNRKESWLNPLGDAWYAVRKHVSVDSLADMARSVSSTIQGEVEERYTAAKDLYEDLKDDLSDLKDNTVRAVKKADDTATTFIAKKVYNAGKVPLFIYEPDLPKGKPLTPSLQRTFIGYQKKKGKWVYDGFFATGETGELHTLKCQPDLIPYLKKRRLFEKIEGEYKLLRRCVFGIGEEYLFVPFPARLIFHEHEKFLAKKYRKDPFTEWFNYATKICEEWGKNALENASVNWVRGTFEAPPLSCATRVKVTESNSVLVLPTFMEYVERLYQILNVFNSQKKFYDNFIAYDEQNVSTLRILATLFELVRQFPQKQESTTKGLSIASFMENCGREKTEEMIKRHDAYIQCTAHLLNEYADEIEKVYLNGSKAKEHTDGIKRYDDTVKICCESLAEILTSPLLTASYIASIGKPAGVQDETSAPKNYDDLDSACPGFHWLENSIVEKIIAESYMALSRWPIDAKRNAFFEAYVLPWETQLAFSIESEQLKIIETLFTDDELKKTYPFLTSGKSLQEIRTEGKCWTAPTPDNHYQKSFLARTDTFLQAVSNHPLKDMPGHLPVVLNAFSFISTDEIGELKSHWRYAARFRANLALGNSLSPTIKPKTGTDRGILGVRRSTHIRSYLKDQCKFGEGFQPPNVINGALQALDMYMAINGLVKICQEIKNEERSANFGDIRNMFVHVQSIGSNGLDLFATCIANTKLADIMTSPLGQVFGIASGTTGSIVKLHALIGHGSSFVENIKGEDYSAAVLDAYKGGLTALQLAESVRSTYYAVKFFQTQRFHYNRLTQKGLQKLGRQVSRQAARKLAGKIASSALLTSSASLSAVIGPLSTALFVYEGIKAIQEKVNQSYQGYYKPFGIIASIMDDLDKQISKDKKFTIHWKEVGDGDIEDSKQVLTRKAYDTSSLIGHTIDYEEEGVLHGDGVKWPDAVRFITGKEQSTIFSGDNMVSIMRNVEPEPAAWALKEMGILPIEAIATFVGMSKAKLENLFNQELNDDATKLAQHLSPPQGGNSDKAKDHITILSTIIPNLDDSPDNKI